MYGISACVLHKCWERVEILSRVSRRKNLIKIFDYYIDTFILDTQNLILT